MTDPDAPPPAMPRPPAAGRSVHLWHAAASADRPGRVERCCEGWLDASERQRAGRFRLPTSRHQHVVGRGMARRLLAGGSLSPAAIEFEQLPHGKPVVRQPAAARRPFNIAHTDGLALCAAADAADLWIGVDVEPCDRRTSPALAERYFSLPEIQSLRAVDAPEQRRGLFLKIWTLKEAFIKAIGTGLRTPLSDFAFFDLEAEQPRVEMLAALPAAEDRSWRFRLITPRPGFVAAIAVAAPAPIRSLSIASRRFEDVLDEDTRLQSGGSGREPS